MIWCRLKFYCVDVNTVPHKLVTRAGVTVSFSWGSNNFGVLERCRGKLRVKWEMTWVCLIVAPSAETECILAIIDSVGFKGLPYKEYLPKQYLVNLSIDDPNSSSVCCVDYFWWVYKTLREKREAGLSFLSFFFGRGGWKICQAFELCQPKQKCQNLYYLNGN